MNVEAIGSIGLHDEVAAPAVPGGTGNFEVPFASRITGGLMQLNQQLLASQTDLQGLAVGETGNLHEVMVRLEESRVALQLMLQVRNRVLEAYQDVMRMQV